MIIYKLKIVLLRTVIRTLINSPHT